MRIFKKLCICISLGLLIFGTFTLPKAYASSDSVISPSPRLNIDEVLSSEKHWVFYVNYVKNESIYDKSYKSITFPNGYRVSRIDKTDISTIGDMWAGHSRTLWVYNYTTY